MRGRQAGMVIAGGLLLAGCAAAGAPERATLPTRLDRPFVAGYHAYWTAGTWADYPLDILDELFFFEIEVGGEGTVRDAHGWPTAWREMVGDAVEAGIQVVPTISMHDAEAFEALFSEAAAIDRLVGTALDLLALDPDLSGIHLDFEVFQTVELAARDGFTAFVAKLAAEMRRTFPARSLSAFVLAFDDDDAYNERALGQLVDYLVVQGYDYHSAESPNAGPVGALRGWGRLSWENVLARFESFAVDRRKLVMGVPLYGYEWAVASEAPGSASLGPGVIVPYDAPPDVLPGAPRARAQAELHGLRRDPESGSPYYVFRRGDGWVQGWFEDAESVTEKVDFVRERGLGGIAFFPLAYGTDELWDAVRRALLPPRWPPPGRPR